MRKYFIYVTQAICTGRIRINICKLTTNGILSLVLKLSLQYNYLSFYLTVEKLITVNRNLEEEK